ncbi:MAG: hypothetical protein GX942_07745 [Papillibacter sp.]|jgi:hypothetical protein|nr:hypothetical protein [Papillibacter sp.]
MKNLKLILKIAAVVAAICGIVFTIIYFRDEIVEFYNKIKGKLGKCCPCHREEDDFEDI